MGGAPQLKWETGHQEGVLPTNLFTWLKTDQGTVRYNKVKVQVGSPQDTKQCNNKTEKAHNTQIKTQ